MSNYEEIKKSYGFLSLWCLCCCSGIFRERNEDRETQKKNTGAHYWLLKRKEKGAYNGIIKMLRLTDKEASDEHC